MSVTTRQGTETGRSARWSWVEATVWSERMLVALDNGVKGGKWFSLMDKVYAPRTLEAAWRRVLRNRGAAGVDQVSVERFGARAEVYLAELHESLKAGTYQPQAVRRVHIPKGPGQTRPLGIPVVKDRIVQTALKFVLEPIFEREFRPQSYGFRPGLGCKDALRAVTAHLQAGATHVVDADLRSYFDSIPHEQLMAQVTARVSDGAVLKLVQAYLSQDILDGLERWTPTAGTPQGAVLSPLLANLYLHALDCQLADAGYRLVRYADDFVVLCTSRVEAEQALAAIRHWVTANGLELHPDKTRLADSRQPGQGFEFLGYRFENGRRWPRQKSQRALRDKIRAQTRRSRGDSLVRIVTDLNPVLRGWFGYFQHADRHTFKPIDGFVRRRLRAIRRKQSKRPGQGHCRADHQRWPNAYFARLGLFTMHEAWVLASQSR